MLSNQLPSHLASQQSHVHVQQTANARLQGGVSLLVQVQETANSFFLTTLLLCLGRGCCLLSLGPGLPLPLLWVLAACV